MVANVHKAQGLSLKNVWVDLRPSNKAAGMTYVALSRATKLADLVIEPMTFDRKENRLCQLAAKTMQAVCKS
jgi:ATP-dependent exoDNAse (exonuclease V) alpha subunit